MNAPKAARILSIAVLVLVAYVAGRQHQSDVVELCRVTASNVSRMMDAYDQANVRMWDALGVAPRQASAPLPVLGDRP